MTPEIAVQTVQEARSEPGPASGTSQAPAVCLRSPRGGKLVVMPAGSDRANALTDWRVAPDVVLRGACACGCGLPVPSEYDGALGGYVPLQKYADPENCRRAVYALMHPTLDLSGMTPERAKHASRMAEEAVRAAKLGQRRATVDASRPVEHDAVNPDTRPSNRLRLTERHWQMLGEIKLLNGLYSGWSYSKIVMDLIEREVEDCRLRSRQEGEHDG